ncbi:MAG TPA: MBL fold metallo-hydrolase [Sphingobium sp.]|jgi:phosphoribosyl 1,2-cyclic phosphate phosphodiesterase|uniref:MBL fold metallo-hydrolase n=1 Tax=unclassified Sphingobium TaxID=2611147 RepID=UPI0007F396B7|nr:MULTISPECIES: MBL fold metallo-hydrolase [unclassified Sphingobium]OAN56421.1 MBL fold metallo-hydrolase [Sphingobium sp. TCM1]HAF40414.1 MBL fold metallo-hydrolase [Sphingobium sp.]
MSLKLTILGSGTSSGVPRIGNDWGECDPAEPKNRRTRVSILVESPTTRLLVDTSPDLRAQLLAADVVHIDAILWTHDHADHSHGLDDVRQIYHHRRSPVPGYARAQTLKLLQRRFAYAFEGANGYHPTIDAHVLPDGLRIGDIDIACVDQPHGDIWSTGFRFRHDGHSIGYATDFHAMTPDMLALYDGLDIWVVDALREKPHPTHPHLALTLDAIAAARPGRAILTHMDQSMDYATLCGTLPNGVEPGYDGMVVELNGQGA